MKSVFRNLIRWQGLLVVALVLSGVVSEDASAAKKQPRSYVDYVDTRQGITIKPPQPGWLYCCLEE